MSSQVKGSTSYRAPDYTSACSHCITRKGHSYCWTSTGTEVPVICWVKHLKKSLGECVRPSGDLAEPYSSGEHLSTSLHMRGFCQLWVLNTDWLPCLGDLIWKVDSDECLAVVSWAVWCIMHWPMHRRTCRSSAWRCDRGWMRHDSYKWFLHCKFFFFSLTVQVVVGS